MPILLDFIILIKILDLKTKRDVNYNQSNQPRLTFSTPIPLLCLSTSNKRRCMEVLYKLKSKKGTNFEGAVHNTIHQLTQQKVNL